MRRFRPRLTLRRLMAPAESPVGSVDRSRVMPLLTRREEDVVRLVAEGLKNREIGLKLNVTEHTVRNYVYRILDKLQLSTRVELILYAVSQRERSHTDHTNRQRLSSGDA
jgi:DNA-binding NarL/FixJ family response regulator